MDDLDDDVQASTCLPVSNAAVDVWHTNAPGAYSGFGTMTEQTWLRGVQNKNTELNGLTIQIVGLHLNGAGIPLFASAPVSFTVI